MSARTIRRSFIASVAATALVVAGAGAPAAAAGVAMTLSSVSGPSGGGNAIVGSVPSSTFPAGSTPVVQFQYYGTGATSCNATAKDITGIDGSAGTTTAGVLTADPASVKRLSTTRVLFQVPSAAYPQDPNSYNPNGLVLLSGQTQSKWNVCVYNSASTTSSSLLASSLYTLVLKPTITSILPTSSPAGGGQSITVNGTGLASAGAAITGAIGGAALTDIVVASDGNSLTATTGPRATGTGLAVTLTTPGGVVSSLNPDNDTSTNDPPIPFSYTNGIVIAPNTAVSGSTVTIDVNGAGFSALQFDVVGNPSSSLAHVFLVPGAYDASTNRGVDECSVDVVVSDNELVCDLNLSGTVASPTGGTPPGAPIPDGVYVLTVVATGDSSASSAAANPTIISSGSAFVVAPY